MHNYAIYLYTCQTCMILYIYTPLGVDTAEDSIAACILSQDALGSMSSHFSNIWPQQYLALVGHPASIAFSSPGGTPNNVPIIFQSAACFGMIRSYKSLSDGISVTVEKKTHSYI